MNKLDSETEGEADGTRSGKPMLLAARNGSLIILQLILAWLALDDITTDNATSFYFEYSMLVMISVLLLLQFLAMIRRGYRIVGVLATILLAVSGYAIATLPPQGQPIEVWRSGAVLTAFFCYLVLGIWVIFKDLREDGRRSLSDGSVA